MGAALDRTGAVLVTGGLGPTRDDITKHAVADLLGMPLEFHDEIWQQLRRALPQPGPRAGADESLAGGGAARRHRAAEPVGYRAGALARIAARPRDHAARRAHRDAQPARARGGAAPRAARPAALVVRSRTVRTTAIPESTLAERLGDIEYAVRPLGLAYLPGLEGVDLRLTSWGAGAAESDARLAAGAAELRRRAGEHVYGEGEETLAEIVVGLLRRAGLDHRRGGVLHRRPARRPAHRRAGELGRLPRRDHRLRQRREDSRTRCSGGAAAPPRRGERAGGGSDGGRRARTARRRTWASGSPGSRGRAGARPRSQWARSAWRSRASGECHVPADHLPRQPPGGPGPGRPDRACSWCASSCSRGRAPQPLPRAIVSPARAAIPAPPDGISVAAIFPLMTRFPDFMGPVGPDRRPRYRSG